MSYKGFGFFELVNKLLTRLKAMYNRGDSTHAAWAETIIISILAPVMGWLLAPHDPFLIYSEFFWMILPPLFVALRHGFSFGVMSCLLLISFLTVFWNLNMAEVPFPTTMLVGMMMIVMLAGEFNDYWQRRLKKLELEQEHRAKRMELFTRSYHLLRISYNHLVEQLAGSSISLRQAVDGVSQEMYGVNAGKYQTLTEKADNILTLFRRYAGVQIASLHYVNEGVLESKALACLGTPLVSEEGLQHCKMIDAALKKGQMLSVLTNEQGNPIYVDGDILAVVPISDRANTSHACMVIYRLPFLRFHEANLRLMAVMSDYLGDLLRNLAEVNSDHVGAVFQTGLQYCHHCFHDYGIQFRLLGIQVRGQLSMKILLSQSRNQDTVWVRKTKGGGDIAMWLLPFTDDFGVEQFQIRIQTWLSEQSEQGIVKSDVVFHAFPVQKGISVTNIIDQVEQYYDLIPE